MRLALHVRIGASRAPGSRGVKVLSRGLKNFVLDDKTSIDEAMAAARDDTDRALTSHQLEAFHKTFNFCMQCRQYICPNCWNDGESRCLTCAPTLGRGILPAPFPHLDPAAGVAAPDESGLAAAALNGHKDGAQDQNGFDALSRLDSLTLERAPTPAAPEMIGASEVEARAEAAEATHATEGTTADGPAAGEAPEPPAMAEAALERLADDDLIGAEVTAVSEVPLAEPDGIAASALETEPEAEVVAAAEADVTAPTEEVAPPPEPITAEAEVVAPTEEIAAAAHAHASLLLEGLQPGQSLDEAIAAFESQPSVAAELERAEVDEVEAAPADVVEAAPAALEIHPEPAAVEPVVAEAIEVSTNDQEDIAAAPIAPRAEPLVPAWEADAEPLDHVAVALDAELPEPAAFIEPLDEIPGAEMVGMEPTIESPASRDDAWLAEPPPEDVVPAELEPALLEPILVESVVVEPVVEPVTVETAPERAAPAIPKPSELAAAASAVDFLEQPTWSITAPAPATIGEAAAPVAEPAIDRVALPAEPPVAPSAPTPAQGVPSQETSWPAQPQWPAPQPSLGLPFLGRHAVPTGGVEALWAESDRAVSAPRAGVDKPAGGVQPCVSCGLSLSATARFCRRCGTSQVGGPGF